MEPAAIDRPLLLPSSPESRSYGSITLALVILLGIGVSTLGTRGPWSFYVAITVVGGVFTLLSVRFGEGRWASPSRLATVAYFVVQFCLAAVLAFLFARQRIFSMQWLVFMPLVAQGRIYLPKWGTVFVSLLSMVIVAAHVYALGGWSSVWGSVIGVATAIIFVLLFTDIALREGGARVESQRLSEELLVANSKLADFAVKAEELAAERERSRLAREIHDSVGHYLTVVHVQLEAAKTMLDRDLEKTRDALGKAQSLTQKGLTEIRNSVASLRESPLAGRRVDQALSELVASLGETGLPAYLEILGDARSLGSKEALTLYRTAQEGLTNARKHSGADRVEVTLDYRRSDWVRLELRDDGSGTSDATGGFGLLGVRERVRQLAGRFEIETEPGRGLRLVVEIPA